MSDLPMGWAAAEARRLEPDDEPEICRLCDCLGDDCGRHTVRTKHDERTLRHLSDLIDKNRALGLELGDHVNVVHDLFAHVDRAAVTLDGLLDGHDSAVNAGAVPAWRGEQHSFWSGGRDILKRAATPRYPRHSQTN